MKRTMCILAVLYLSLLFMLPVSAESVDFDSLTTEELVMLRDAIDQELFDRGETDVFTVAHDAEYLATRQYIFEFLLGKNYKVQTLLGVPNIGRIEDDDPTDHYVGWFAYIERNGNWQEHVVLLFDGEVVSCIPSKK